MKYIYHHLGLGDHVICNGLVRSLIKNNVEYKMFVKSHNYETVKFMYRDLKNLDFILGDDEFVTNFLNSNSIKKEDIIIAGFYRHPQSIEFDDSFYLQNNIPFEKRWSDFKCERDFECEIKLFNKYNVKENEYIFIHDDHSRGIYVNENFILNKSLPIVRPIKGYTQNSFDYCYLMEKSFESHFIDSSFRLIFDSLQLRETNIFYHVNYKSVLRDSTTKSQSKLDFKIL